MNQAKEIRNKTIQLLKEKNNITQKFSINGKRINGIKYTHLKNYFIYNYPEFTEGAITGALQTLTNRVDNVFKTKTKDGVFFFYTEDTKGILESPNQQLPITESEDYSNLEEKVEEVSKAVGEILRNASKGKYSSTHNRDISYLRDILEASENLQSALKTYKREDAIEKIERQNPNHPFYDDGMPF